MNHKLTRIVAMLLTIVLCFSAAACTDSPDPANPTELTDPTEFSMNPTIVPTESTEPTTAPTMVTMPHVDANASLEQVRMSGFHQDWVTRFANRLGETVTVKSAEELEIVLDQVRLMDKSFTLQGNYDEHFFETSVIVLIPMQSTSGSVRYQAEATAGSDSLTIKLQSGIDGIGTADMADWLLMVVLPRAEYDCDLPITVEGSQSKIPESNLNINDR